MEDSPGTAWDAVAEALRAFSKDNVAALRGTRAIEGASFGGVVMAYRQLKRAAERIADQVEDHGEGTVLLQAGYEAADFTELRAFLARLRMIEKGLDKEIALAMELLLDEPKRRDFAGAAVVAGPLISGALAIGSLLLRSDVIEKHGAVTIDDRVLVDAVAKRLQGGGKVEVLHPTTVALAPPDLEAVGDDRLAAKLATVEGKGQRMRELLATVETRLARTVSGAPEQQDTLIEALAGAKARLEAALKLLGVFWDGFAGMAARLLRADTSAAKLAGNGRILGLKVLTGGGGTRVEVNSFGRDRVEHSGGVVVSFTLFDTEGGILASELLSEYSTARESDEVIGTWEC